MIHVDIQIPYNPAYKYSFVTKVSGNLSWKIPRCVSRVVFLCSVYPGIIKLERKILYPQKKEKEKRKREKRKKKEKNVLVQCTPAQYHAMTPPVIHAQ